MSKPKRITAGLTLFALLAIAIGPAQGMWQNKKLGPPVIATLDLERVFNEINRRNVAEAALAQELEGYRGQAEDLKAQAERQKTDLELLVPGTEKYEKAEKEWVTTVLNYKAMVAFIQAKLDAVRAGARREIYDAITTAAAEFAKANGIDFIITNDSGLELQEGKDIQIVQQLALRRVVFASAAFDVTDDLITWMNAP